MRSTLASGCGQRGLGPRAGWLVLAAWLTGCSPSKDPVLTNQQFGPDDAGAVRILSVEERTEALAAMKSVVSGPVEVPTPAPDGVRWSDIFDAALWATYDVDMAVASTRRNDDDTEVTFDLVTTRDEPGTLIVRRAAAPQMVSATASVGTFGQRRDEATQLVERFNVRLREFGRKPGF